MVGVIEKKKKQQDDNSSNGFDNSDPNALLLGQKNKNISVAKKDSNYRDINTYKPTETLYIIVNC